MCHAWGLDDAGVSLSEGNAFVPRVREAAVGHESILKGVRSSEQVSTSRMWDDGVLELSY